MFVNFGLSKKNVRVNRILRIISQAVWEYETKTNRKIQRKHYEYNIKLKECFWLYLFDIT